MQRRPALRPVHCMCALLCSGSSACYWSCCCPGQRKRTSCRLMIDVVIYAISDAKPTQPGSGYQSKGEDSVPSKYRNSSRKMKETGIPGLALTGGSVAENPKVLGEVQIEGNSAIPNHGQYFVTHLGNEFDSVHGSFTPMFFESSG